MTTLQTHPPSYSDDFGPLHVSPWGRSFEEYVAMFALSEEDLGKRILGCADGPASFNAVASGRGCRVVSADPVYRLSVEQLRSRIGQAAAHIGRLTEMMDDEFVRAAFGSPEELLRVRRAAMETFLDDFPGGLREGRYVDALLPALPFPDGHFDIALCSHFLFLYSRRFDSDFHVAAIAEMRRTSAEVRVFPLSELDATLSPHLTPVIAGLRRRGLLVERVRVPYEFQRYGNEMLHVV